MEFFAASLRSDAAPADPSRRALLRAAPVAAGVAATAAAFPGAAAATAPREHLRRGPRMESSFIYYDDPAEHQRIVDEAIEVARTGPQRG